MRAHWRRIYTGQEASAPQTICEAKTLSLALGVIHPPEHSPLALFGDSYSGFTLLGENRKSHKLVHGLGPDWRQLATTGDNA